MANFLGGLAGGNQQLYDLAIVATSTDPIPTSVGFTITPTCDLDGLGSDVDTLLVSGGDGRVEASKDERIKDFLRRSSLTARRYGSVCTGAFPLAAAGLLDGRRATTHWARAAELQRLYPKVKVEPDRIFTRDRNVYTSAGITAGIDLALALIAEDHGKRLALEVARRLVVPFKRAGGQSQFSAHLEAQFIEAPGLAAVRDWAAENLPADLSVAALAKRAGMSPRNFARSFKQATGMTPADFVIRLRLDKARGLLETTTLQLKAVATQCGFGSADVLRRLFVERLDVTPGEFRTRMSIRDRTANSDS